MRCIQTIQHRTQTLLRSTMSSIQRFHVGKRMSEMTVYNGVAFLAGQVAGNLSGDIRQQTTEVLASIDRLLAEAGSSKARILRAEIFLRDIADFTAMNSVWETWVSEGNTPARATVQATMYHPDCLVEILITAAA
jgi:enamine deaminase RidA (YjgF/YER057c/UK114 family)